MAEIFPFRKTKDRTPEITEAVDAQSQTFEAVLADNVTPTGLNVEEVGLALREKTKSLKRAIVNLDGDLFTKIMDRLPARFSPLNGETFASAEYAADAYADAIRLTYKDVIAEHSQAGRDALDQAVEPEKKAHGLMEAPWKKDREKMPNPRIYLDWVGHLTTQIETGDDNLVTYDEFSKEDAYKDEDPYLPIEEYGRTWLDKGGRFLAGLGGSLATAVAEGWARDSLEENAPRYILPKIKENLNDDALFTRLEPGLTTVITQLGSFPVETMALFLDTVNARFTTLKQQTSPTAEASLYGAATVEALRVAITGALGKDIEEVPPTDSKYMRLTALRDIFAALPEGKVVTPAWSEALNRYLDTSEAPTFAGFKDFIETETLSEDSFYADPFEDLAPTPPEDKDKKPAEEESSASGEDEPPVPGDDVDATPQHAVVARADVDAFLVLEENGVRTWSDLAIETIDGREYITYKFRGPDAKKPLDEFASLDGIVLWKESLDTAAYDSGKIDIGKEMAHAFERAGGFGKGGVAAALGVLLTLAFKNLGGFFDFFTGGKDKKGQKEKKEKKGYTSVAELFKTRFGLDFEADRDAEAAWEAVQPIRMYVLNLFVTKPEDPAIAPGDKTALEGLKAKMGDEKWALFIKDALETDLGGKTGREQFGDKPDHRMTINQWIQQNHKRHWPAS